MKNETIVDKIMKEIATLHDTIIFPHILINSRSPENIALVAITRQTDPFQIALKHIPKL